MLEFINMHSEIEKTRSKNLIVIYGHNNYYFVCNTVIADFTTPGESHVYGLPLSLCRLLRPLGPFFVL